VSNSKMGGISPAQLKKLMSKFMKDQRYLAGKKLKKPGANVSGKSLAGLNKMSTSMLQQLISPKPKTAKRGGKIKKKR
jgi:hypothetical protein